ncbi:MAG: AraC family transcriptional regulator [Acidobacteriia bacterium]|nr:AraC family transcriptional regulator [Terriglobia bacterium]
MIPGDKQVAPRAIPLGAAREPMHTANLRGMFGALARLGYDIDALLAPFGLSRADLDDPDGRLPAQVCAEIFAAIKGERRVKNLALCIAVETPIGAYPLLDYLICSSESVGEGLKQLARYLGLVNPAVHLVFREEEDPIRVLVEGSIDPFTVELTVSLSVLRLMRESGDQLQVARICFRHEPDDASAFQRVLHSAVETQSSWSGFALTREAWRLPLRRRDPLLRNWLEHKAARILAVQAGKEGVAMEVRRLLAAPASGTSMSIETVARRLAMSPRTLQRRLSEEGTSFDTLREEIRKQTAEILLADRTLSVGEVAFLLGFSEPGAFHRAFRRWHNTTPDAFRKQQSNSLQAKWVR